MNNLRAKRVCLTICKQAAARFSVSIKSQVSVQRELCQRAMNPLNISLKNYLIN